MLQQKVLRRGVVAAQPHREVIMQHRGGPVVIQQRPIIIRRGGIRKRAILNGRNVIAVRNAVFFELFLESGFQDYCCDLFHLKNYCCGNGVF